MHTCARTRTRPSPFHATEGGEGRGSSQPHKRDKVLRHAVPLPAQVIFLSNTALSQPEKELRPKSSLHFTPL